MNAPELKIASVLRHDMGGEVVESYLIEDADDLAAYQKLREEHVRQALTHVLRSPVPIEKFDHDIPSDRPYTGMMRLAWHRANSVPDGVMFGGNPFFQIEGAAIAGLNGMRKALGRGDVVLANSNGGWHTVAPSIMEVVGVRRGSLEGGLEAIRLPAGSRLLALENDTKLSDGALAYVRGRDEKYSLVTSLRSRKGSEVSDAIRFFAQMGGTTVFAETTGGDVEQLQRIAGALPKLGITQVIVRPVGGMSAEMEAVKAAAKAAGLIVVVLNEYPSADGKAKTAKRRRRK